MLKGHTSTSLILIGVLAVIVGIFAIAWPGATILALVILFAVYAFIDAGLQTMRAFSGRTAGPVLGAPAARAGRPWWPAWVALTWARALTAFVLVIVVAAWALAGGVAEFFARLPKRGERGHPRAVSSCPGWCRSRSAYCCSPAPGAGVLTLALLFGPVRLDLRVLADHRRHPAPPARRATRRARGGSARRGDLRRSACPLPGAQNGQNSAVQSAVDVALRTLELADRSLIPVPGGVVGRRAQGGASDRGRKLLAEPTGQAHPRDPSPAPPSWCSLLFLVLFRPGAFDPADPSPAATRAESCFWVGVRRLLLFGLT